MGQQHTKSEKRMRAKRRLKNRKERKTAQPQPKAAFVAPIAS